ncbi:hypothetical protein NDU88_008017 [Pleurodeles waltl]|uniref:Uncharacterized protein n=1 Tax=Pleurodeles waltl TaxID=8319 RepID=A0AAV7VV96_PLEWA|nr:hypothetical protein NDU88_008017 [Pleurodeles waltl]
MCISEAPLCRLFILLNSAAVRREGAGRDPTGDMGSAKINIALRLPARTHGRLRDPKAAAWPQGQNGMWIAQRRACNSPETVRLTGAVQRAPGSCRVGGWAARAEGSMLYVAPFG